MITNLQILTIYEVILLLLLFVVTVAASVKALESPL